jgi:hypothetical protein
MINPFLYYIGWNKIKLNFEIGPEDMKLAYHRLHVKKKVLKASTISYVFLYSFQREELEPPVLNMVN